MIPSTRIKFFNPFYFTLCAAWKLKWSEKSKPSMITITNCHVIQLHLICMEYLWICTYLPTIYHLIMPISFQSWAELCVHKAGTFNKWKKKCSVWSGKRHKKARVLEWVTINKSVLLYYCFNVINITQFIKQSVQCVRAWLNKMAQVRMWWKAWWGKAFKRFNLRSFLSSI